MWSFRTLFRLFIGRPARAALQTFASSPDFIEFWDWVGADHFILEAFAGWIGTFQAMRLQVIR
jgi:hypothetical protein